VWRDVARQASLNAADLHYHQLSPHGNLRDIKDRWSAKFGADADGAVLIRPDGFIAWRARDGRGRPAAALRNALEHLAFRTPAAH
jgi:putative polyketide hydroxylase